MAGERRCVPGCGRRPSGSRQVPPRPPPRMCGSSPNASYWSTGNWRTRAASSTDWCTSSPRPHRRKTRTRPPRASQSRRHRRPTRPSCYRCPASAPASSLVCLPRVATRCGGGTTPRFAVSAGWRRSPGVRARACSWCAAWLPTTGCATPPTTGLASLPTETRSAAPSIRRSPRCATRGQQWPTLPASPHAPRRHLLRPAPCRKCHRVNS